MLSAAFPLLCEPGRSHFLGLAFLLLRRGLLPFPPPRLLLFKAMMITASRRTPPAIPPISAQLVPPPPVCDGVCVGVVVGEVVDVGVVEGVDVAADVGVVDGVGVAAGVLLTVAPSTDQSLRWFVWPQMVLPVIVILEATCQLSFAQ